MASLEVVINSRVYQIGCDEKEKDYVKSIANDLNNRITKLRQKDPDFFSKLDDEKLFLYQMLLLCSEINDLKNTKKTNKAVQLTEKEQFSSTDISRLNQSINSIKKNIRKLDDLIK